ncbi:MAG TPA: GH25 family lysozyme [Chthoniobacterales bacterium]|jgi:lysozyme|nr:GH25 family lysozyme [Chthoniobacterales bacterium]
MRRRLLTVAGCLIGLVIVGLALCFLGIWIPNAPLRSQYPVRGIDVSHHQGRIDWSAVKASGIQFAYIKATEGADFTDATFGENWNNSKAAGIVRGPYHFFTLSSSGQSQAAHFIATVPADDDALPPAIDLQFSGANKDRRPPSDEFQRELATFWDALVAHYRKVPVVYTATDFQKQYLRFMPIERLWIRDVALRPDSGWTFWQFSARGRVQGVPTFVDLNAFHSSPQEFVKLAQVRND